ncbi:F-box/FBD/LRR-repeat protein At1g16930-like [Elaeis guineensis]|uniref:F-box/FBD/LRR-repeat protein At1g16930-like n=1 Tax=Elaeis guineensis var. tenera TaxID=51953 RepID=A0A6I9Q968_ELAGV|nr:F-box/FBD/LRR-repeat protein At1g16930-like [Elaeis guineensis]
MAKPTTNKNHGINDLSDAALLHILSFLPTKNAAQTSLLSKRWRYLWIRVPVLDIDCSNLVCSSDLYAALQHRKHSPIRKLRLQFHGTNHCFRHFSEFKDWIYFSMRRGLEEFYLDGAVDHPTACLSSDHRPSIDKHLLPIGLMTYKNLRVLSLKDCSINACVRMDFGCLETLRLSRPRVKPQVLQQLIDSCPLLRSFVLEFYEHLKNLELRCQNLKSMKLICFHSRWSRIEFDMPNLQSFYYKGYLPEQVFSLTNPVNLIDAEICFCKGLNIYTDISFRNFISKFGQAKFLRLITPKIEEFVISKNLSEGLPPFFQRLKQLELKGSMTSTHTIFAIANFLEFSPILEVLSMIFVPTATKMSLERKETEFQASISCLRHHQMMMDSDMESDDAEFHELPKVSYNCLQHHLRKIKLVNFQGGADEMKLAKFLIGSAIALEEIHIQGIEQTFCHHMRVKRKLLRWITNPHTEVTYV